MITVVISSSNPFAAGKAEAGRAGWEHISLIPYIEHKIGLDIETIKAEGEEHFKAIVAEAVRDVLMMREVTGENLVFSLDRSTFETPVLNGLILRQASKIIDTDIPDGHKGL